MQGLIRKTLVLIALLGGLQACSTGRLLRYAIRPVDTVRSGTVVAPALPDEVIQIHFDAKAHPAVMAGTVTGALFGQGYVVAEERAFQMDLLRHIAQGRLAEWAGQTQLDQDRLMRRLALTRMAAADVAALPATEAARLQAYTDGVNAALPSAMGWEHSVLGQEMAPWTVTDSVTVMHLVSWMFSGNLKDEVLGARLLSAVGPRAWLLFPTGFEHSDFLESFQTEVTETGLAELYPVIASLDDWLVEGGSNNWAFNADRSAGGAPVIANDPHVTGNIVPGFFAAASLFWGPAHQLSAAGLCIPGVPGIVAGRNSHVAWTMTNNYGDVQDLVLEQVTADGKHYLQNGKTVPFAERTEDYIIRDRKGNISRFSETVSETVRGPLLTGAAWDLTEPVSLLWAPRVYPLHRFPLVFMLEATTTTALLELGRFWGGAPMNVVYAATDGTIGHQVIGRVPMRVETTGVLPVRAASFPFEVTIPWEGLIAYEQLPRVETMSGWVGTANHNVAGADYPVPYSSRFAPGYRFWRMQELFDEPVTRSADWHRIAQLDFVSIFARETSSLIAAAIRSGGDADTIPVAVLLENWDGGMAVDSTAATVFHTLVHTFLVSSLEDEIPAALLHDLLAWPYFYHERMFRQLLSGKWPWADDRRTPQVETVAKLWQAAARRLVQEESAVLATPWGQAHRLYLHHPFAREKNIFGKLLGAGNYAAAGDGDTILRAGWLDDETRDAVWIAGARIVMDLADNCRMSGVLATGQGGRWRSQHYDDHVASYLHGRLHSWPLCADSAQQSSVSSIQILRSPKQ